MEGIPIMLSLSGSGSPIEVSLSVIMAVLVSSTLIGTTSIFYVGDKFLLLY